MGLKQLSSGSQGSQRWRGTGPIVGIFPKAGTPIIRKYLCCEIRYARLELRRSEGICLKILYRSEDLGTTQFVGLGESRIIKEGVNTLPTHWMSDRHRPYIRTMRL